MSLFSDKELGVEQTQKLNQILPEGFKRPIWKMSDFKGSDSLYQRFSSNLKTMVNISTDLEKKIKKLKKEISTVEASNIIIFNTELYDARPLGMVDVGIVEKFGAPTTGDRFAGGAIGYAIESAIDDAYIKSSIQEQAVNRVKFELLKKARAIYPDCNLLFKFQVDFREMGSSGNVFIYMRGTAAKGENQQLDRAIAESVQDIEKLERDLKVKKAEIEELTEIRNKIPRDKNQITELLG
ncbi:hypothetical protein [Robiginitalea marina]|uniref:Uncharacterized protein n=1 Tax=Robiginitalea marina TaxID=2954105 RepID=A0ABT1AX96_9FLAO|nr:hypothetical protein [Robiginitalea marina]MCO5724660.1 hypothetical protein [Robiginitalea marina]